MSRKKESVVIPADSQLGIFLTKLTGPPVRVRIEVRERVERMSSKNFQCLLELLDHHVDMKSPMFSGSESLCKVVEFLLNHSGDNPADAQARTRFSLAVASLRTNRRLLKSGGGQAAFWKIVDRRTRG